VPGVLPLGIDNHHNVGLNASILERPNGRVRCHYQAAVLQPFQVCDVFCQARAGSDNDSRDSGKQTWQV
jgi:hypothetical protein